jgi:magnesium chelatase family protein
MAKISGPLLDRIDLYIEVPSAPYKELSAAKPGTSSNRMREHVLAAARSKLRVSQIRRPA